jgi:hypothetical protein
MTYEIQGEQPEQPVNTNPFILWPTEPNMPVLPEFPPDAKDPSYTPRPEK